MATRSSQADIGIEGSWRARKKRSRAASTASRGEAVGVGVSGMVEGVRCIDAWIRYAKADVERSVRNIVEEAARKGGFYTCVHSSSLVECST